MLTWHRVSLLLCCVLLAHVVALPSDMPIALHQLVSVDTASDAVIRLKGWDAKTPKLTYTISSLPASGTLYQLSHIFSNYGNNPKAGIPISVGMNVTGSSNRIYYKRPSPDVNPKQMYGEFQFVVDSGRASNGYTTASVSYPGTITLVPLDGAYITSDFMLNDEGWMITGNKQSTSSKYEPYSRSAILNHYILGSDDVIHSTVSSGSSVSTDSSLWYFHAPSKFYGNRGIAYGGKLSFTIGGFSGNFNLLNAGTTPVVELECATCVGPVTKGVRLVYPLATMLKKQKLFNDGSSTSTIELLLKETSGWLIDPQNTLAAWKAPTTCQFIQVLSSLSSLNILGDFTTWYETVALDNVRIITNTNKQTNQNNDVLPLCALKKPDASVCSC